MKVGLALSGGGIRGISHLGVIKALEELGYEIKGISGASAGAIVGAFYAAGVSPDEILELIKSRPFYRLMKPAFSGKGLISMDWLEGEIEKYLPVETFEQLRLPIKIVATDLSAGKSRYFHSGPIVKPMMASCCIPILFYPVKVNGREFVDGGILDNLPVKTLKKEHKKIIGVSCNPINRHFEATNMKSVTERTFLLAINGNVKTSAKRCTHFIEPPELFRYNVMEVSKAEEIFRIGYEYTLRTLENVKELTSVQTN